MSQFSNDPNIPADAWSLLSPQLTDKRRQRIITTAAHRTNKLRLVVQDVHQPHNVSACIRSAEAFGVQNIDVVTLSGKFSTSTVARGVDEWVDIHRYDNVADCINKLHQQGYVVAAAFPHGDAINLDAIDVSKPLAVAFGNEHEGLSTEWRDLADFCFTIPMFGIVESLNISVSAAITLHQIIKKMKEKLPAEQYFLTATEQQFLLNKWICRQIKTWPVQLPRLRAEKNDSPR